MIKSYRFYRSIGYTKTRAIYNAVLDTRLSIAILG